MDRARTVEYRIAFAALNTNPVIKRKIPPSAQKVDTLLALTRRSILLDIRIAQDMFEENLTLPLEDSRVRGLGYLR